MRVPVVIVALTLAATIGCAAAIPTLSPAAPPPGMAGRIATTVSEAVDALSAPLWAMVASLAMAELSEE